MGEELNILLNIEIVLLYLPTAVLIIGTIVVGMFLPIYFILIKFFLNK